MQFVIGLRWSWAGTIHILVSVAGSQVKGNNVFHIFFVALEETRNCQCGIRLGTSIVAVRSREAFLPMHFFVKKFWFAFCTEKKLDTLYRTLVPGYLFL
jgi:hypothetical protein